MPPDYLRLISPNAYSTTTEDEYNHCQGLLPQRLYIVLPSVRIPKFFSDWANKLAKLAGTNDSCMSMRIVRGSQCYGAGIPWNGRV